MPHFTRPISFSRGAILAAAIWFGAAAVAAEEPVSVGSVSPLPDSADAFETLPNRRLGDAALAAGDYSTAEAHYRAYRAAAVARGNAVGVQDAALRIINARIQAGNAAGAQAAADEFASTFAAGNVYVLKLLEADIAMLKGDLPGAEKLMREQLANAALPPDLRKPLSYALGEVLMRMGKYADAAAVYADINARKPEFDAAFRRIFALQLGDELIASQNLLNELRTDPEMPGQQTAVTILQINQAIRERRFSEAAAMWLKLPEVSPDNRLYVMALDLADHFKESEVPASRIEFLKAAFNASPGAPERKYVLAQLIGQYAADHNESAAIEAMNRYLKLFPADSNRFENLLQLAHLMSAAKNFSGAAAVYEKLLSDKESPEALKLQAARECAAVCELLADRKTEQKMLEFMIGHSSDDAQLAEAHLAMANFLFNGGDFKAAAEQAGQAASAETPSRLAALYTLMNARQRAQDYPAALEAARELKKQPDDAWRQKGVLGEARIMEASGDIQGAITAYAAFGSSWEFSDARQEALFSAGTLAMESGYYSRASELFKLLAERYPKYKGAPYALYLSVYAEFMQQRPSEMEKLISTLRKDFPNSKYTVQAMLWQLDLLKMNRDFAGAEKLLAAMAADYAGREPEVVEQIRYEQACLELLSGKDEAAAALLAMVTQSEAPSVLRAKSEFALGDIEMKSGHYVEAEGHFKRASELAPDAEFRLSCTGRIADSYYASGAKDGDESKLEGAVVFYNEVLKSAAPESLAWYQAGCMVGIAELKRGNTAVGVGRLFAVLNAAAEDAAITPAAAWWVRKAANALVDHVVADGLSDDQAKLIAVLRKLRVSGAPHEFGPLWFEANCRIADTLARRGDRRAARECYRQLIAEASGVAPLSETEDSLLLMAAENLAKLCLADGSAAALDVALGALDTVEKTSQSGRAKLAALRAEVQAAYNLK